MPNPQHAPTNESRQLVKIHTMVGSTQEQISAILKIDPKTLRKHYREELDTSLAQAVATIGGVLYNKAKEGDFQSMKLFLTTRGGWSEKSQIDHISSDESMSPTRIELVAPSDDSKD